ncbi:hypothetical protein GXP67_08375 [Rhodocytophaga rosea]|uniref:Uncharacterized protein n=1 Tax=Rhodocytophaga rosea TaxID=2704465 RepID=A0A6C0GFZ9_9BACT|nr:hypothetical protein [Rhodocytophaga rosea]QHT66672.1 hypothetical protein GXP67_08375 [Rhodocytophaga rosea]
MIIPWLHTPYLNLTHVASKLYGSKSRLHTHRLQKKMNSILPFEQWELQQLEKIKHDLFYHLEQGTPTESVSQ